MEGTRIADKHSNKPKGVFYIDANRTYFYQEAVDQVLQLDIPREVFSNMEIINRNKMEALINSFIISNKIPPSSLIIALSSNIVFEKDFLPSAKSDEEIQKFLDLVPFEEPVNQRFNFAGRIKVVAANKEIIDLIQGVFMKNNSEIVGAFPLSFLQIVAPELTKNIDLKVILGKADDIKLYNFLKIQKNAYKPKPEETKKSKRLYVLVGLFVILMFVMIILLYQTLFSQPKPSNILPKPVVKTTPIFTAPTTLSSPSAVTSPTQ